MAVQHGLSVASKSVAVIGAGPAGLMAAEVLARGDASVTLYDRMPSAGRKFLLAGRGGLNLTHSEPVERLLSRYGAAEARLAAAILAFPPDALRAWSAELGQPTFVGSSGRIFPQAFKASPLLRAWLRRLDAAGIVFKPRHAWTGWDPDGALLFTAPAGPVAIRADATVLALGGASWPQLGSDGAWTAPIAAEAIDIVPLRPANCGFRVAWSEPFARKFEGTPLKGIALSFADRRLRGEALITRSGLEGGGIYALSAQLRAAIEATGSAILRLDLKPDRDLAAIEARLTARGAKQSLSNGLRKALALSPAAIGLLREAWLDPAEPLGTLRVPTEIGASIGEVFPSGDNARVDAAISVGALSPDRLARLIKNLPLRLTGTMPIDRAISTAGGIAWAEIDAHFMLERRPGLFVAGEMLDWEAPTGGYLLQACLATGAAAATGALHWLARSSLS